MKWIAGIALLLLAGATFVWYTRSGAADELDDRARIEAFFEERDSRAAYESFKAAYQRDDITITHPAAHIFGEFLYRSEGLEGFAICDAAFGFGCYHSFIGAAIAEHGESAVQRFDEICVASYGNEGLGCVHGIGHGMLAYFGYSDEALAKSLDGCRSLTWKHPYGGCRDGVFMEYNFRTMQGDAERESRNFTLESRHAPCANVALDAQIACYFGQPAWWDGALRGEQNAADTMLSFCREVETMASREACVRGIGYAAAPSQQFSASSGIAYCDGLSGNERERVLCREGYAWALWSNTEYREESAALCREGLDTASAALCEQEFLFTIR